MEQLVLRRKIAMLMLFFISRVEYQPDSVTVYAPKEKLDSINILYTEQLNYVLAAMKEEGRAIYGVQIQLIQDAELQYGIAKGYYAED